MMLIQSERYDIQVKECRDWRQRRIYMVVYGLQVKQFEDFDNAMSEFKQCVYHARACNDEI